MKYYIIAGEASGDLHGSILIKEICRLDANVNLRGWGGDMMEAVGVVLAKHYRETAFMGFIEVVKNLPAILKNLQFCKQDILAFSPDVLVLIDYPGFNLRIAKWAKQQGLKVIYYISPQVWAWKESRVKLIKQVVDKMLVILPFEKAFYKKWNYEVEYVGHPLIQVIDEFKKTEHQLQLLSGTTVGHQSIIALLPGSRKQEINNTLPIMLEAVKKFPNHQFIIAQSPGLTAAFYEPFFQGYNNVFLSVQGQTYALLSVAKAALVSSGTATLETALFNVPQVVCYKTSSISYQVAKALIKIKYISLVNLIMNKKMVTELIQHQLNAANITESLKPILYNTHSIEEVKHNYMQLRNLLGQQQNASARAARAIVEFLNS